MRDVYLRYVALRLLAHPGCVHRSLGFWAGLGYVLHIKTADIFLLNPIHFNLPIPKLIV